MRKLYIKLLLGLLFILGSVGVQGQNVNVNPGGGSYATLQAAFAAINTGTHTGAITIDIVNNTTETGTAVLNASGVGGSSYTSILIQPAGAFAVSGNITGPLVDLNGATNVTIDGRVGGVGTTKSLTFSNTSTVTAGSAIRYINEASANSVKYCVLKALYASTTSGIIFFSTTSGSNGNDNNIIDNCDIDGGAGGTASPTLVVANGIYSSGTTTTTATQNSGNTISNCNIFNCFNAGLVSTGINLSSGNTDWTINANSFYQTTARVVTTSNAYTVININNTTGGNNFIITNNFIGGTAANAGGTAWSVSATANRFIGIGLAVGTTTATTVQNNTITNISQSTTSGAATTNGIWCGINVTAGNVNIGTSAANTIGGTTGNNAISTTCSSTGGLTVGINISSSGTVTAQNNKIGSITANGSTTSVSASIIGIQASGAGLYDFSSNIIGSTTTLNSINSPTVSTNATAQVILGISLTSGVTTNNTVTISNNTIANMNQAGSGTAHYIRGIFYQGTGNTATNIVNINSNTIFNLTGANTNPTVASSQFGVMGILFLAANTTTFFSTPIINNNTIYTLSSTSATSVQANVVAIGATNCAGVGSIAKNKIYDLRNASTMTTITTAPTACGINIRQVQSGSVTVSNNMISLGSAQTTNTQFMGIWNSLTAAGAINIYFNSVSIAGTATTGALPSFGLLRGDNSTTAITTTLTVKNNILTNTRTGGTGKHYAIANDYNATASVTGWAANVSDYNLLNAAVATVGYWTSDRTFATWKTASSGDANSLSGNSVTFVDAPNGDLHLTMGVTPTQLESGGITGTGITVDFDNQVRPGPAGSVNGGALAPDLGADEFDGVPLDILPPSIIYSPLINTCDGSVNRTLTATIADPSGVPQSGAGLPVLYWKINAGAYTGVTGTWVNGNTYTFSFGAGAVSADVISYYIVAQDNAGTPNVGAFPSAGATGFSINPPAASTPPTTPTIYSISATLNGTYTVGTGQTYTTLTAAIAAYNNSCLGGPVVFSLTDATYSSAETFPIIINANASASATNTLTIRPASTSVITGNSTVAILKLNGADYVTIDGSNNGTNTKNLTISNTNTSTTGVIVWLGSASASDGATNNAVKNCIISGNAPTTTFGGIISSSGTTVGGVAEAANSGNSYINNTVNTTTWGIAIVGPTGNESGTIISGNLVGSVTAANKIGLKGIAFFQQAGVSVTNNTIFGVSTSTTSTVSGIYVAGTQAGGIISNNKINDIKNTNSSGYGANGIGLYSSSTTGNVTVQNNMVYDVTGNGWTTVTETDNGYGIMINTGGGYNIHFNTVSLSTNQGSAGVTAAINIAAAVTALNISNNIFTNTQTTGTRYAIYTAGTAAAFTSINYNDYIAQNVGFLTSGRATLANWQAATSQDARSISVAPVFVSSTDLHLTTANCGIDGRGVPVAGITSDFDNTTRDLGAPDMGAHEFIATLSGSLAIPVGPGTTNVTYNVSPLGTTFSNSSCETIAKVLPSGGGTAVTGLIKAGVTVDASVQTYNLEPYVQRHFDIEPATNPATSTATVTLYFTDAEFVNYNANSAGYKSLPTSTLGNADPNIANLRVNQYHGTGTLPGNYTGSLEVINPADVDIVWNSGSNRWEVTIPVTGFSGFYVTTPLDVPLAIGVVYFRGTKQNHVHNLTWKVNCTNSSKATMTLERSGDGRNFTSINTITANAVRCLDAFYYDDVNPLPGINYYRLKSVDDNGNITYSSIVTLLNKEKGFEIVNISPNPTVNGQFKLNVTTTQQTKMDVIITDMAGKVVSKKAVTLANGFNAIDMNVSNLASGTYQLFGNTAEGKTTTLSFVKQ